MQTFVPAAEPVRVCKLHLVQERIDEGEHAPSVADLATELGRLNHIIPNCNDRLGRDGKDVALQQAMLLQEKIPNRPSNQVTLDMMSYDWRRARTAHRARHVVRTNTRKHMEKELGISSEDKAAEAILIAAEEAEVFCD